ncbi:MAG: hypothetical protein FD176_2992, partial [Rhodospirillaceae bacterium]
SRLARLARFTGLARFTPLTRLAARTVVVGITRCAILALVLIALAGTLDGIITALLVVVPLRLLRLVVAILVLGRHFGLILGRGRQILRPALAVILVIGVDQAEIMFRVLIEILGGMAVALAGGIAGQTQILFHHLMGIAANPALGAVGIEHLAANIDIADVVATATATTTMAAAVPAAAVADAIGIAAVIATAP